MCIYIFHYITQKYMNIMVSETLTVENYGYEDVGICQKHPRESRNAAAVVD